MKKRLTRVSIVLPCFNCESTLCETVGSILAQSFLDYELIFVDDASTDSTNDVIKNLCEEHKGMFRSIHLEKNIGPGGARNKGVQSAKSNLICLIDSDDTWESNKLEEQYDYHQETHCAFSCTGFTFGTQRIRKGKTDYASLLKNNVINTSSIMIDVDQININFPRRSTSEDYLTWLRIAKKHRIHFINKVLVNRRVFDGISSNKFNMAKQRWRIYRSDESLPLLSSIYYFLHYAASGLYKYINKD